MLILTLAIMMMIMMIIMIVASNLMMMCICTLLNYTYYRHSIEWPPDTDQYYLMLSSTSYHRVLMSVTKYYLL